MRLLGRLRSGLRHRRNASRLLLLLSAQQLQNLFRSLRSGIRLIWVRRLLRVGVCSVRLCGLSGLSGLSLVLGRIIGRILIVVFELFVRRSRRLSIGRLSRLPNELPVEPGKAVRRHRSRIVLINYSGGGLGLSRHRRF